ncbi:exo 1,3/1,4-beta-D-glucan glucohydrolase [Oleiagrimonas sp.]|jgi:beta-glucosidase|uniref:glycoside hydrolase family 3 protein n=1 Tax=Oleiagrimonas sp. TaxID=2010330 RepID=UPI002622B748|nr:exo 1,3/1,4-beta-D-glucan glucohydrolase [Oleiagrimonas sp.]MDA3914327.1 exo 1,3/1,4-beta-D-glucan glucohydrolase [Oleiagrimonas sp.]
MGKIPNICDNGLRTRFVGWSLPVALLALSMAGCGRQPAPQQAKPASLVQQAKPAAHAQQVKTAAASQPAIASTVAHPSQWPSVKPAFPPQPKLEHRVHELLSHMTLRQKVGQLIQGEIGSMTPEDLRTYPLGSVLSGGNGGPGGNAAAPAAKWRALIQAYHREAMRPLKKGGVVVPVIFGLDAVHGNNDVVGATLFPQNIALGATHDPDLVRKIGAATALEVRAIGADWAFAPTIAVPQNSRWGRTYEGFSQNPHLVAKLGAAEIEGLQGKPGTPGFLDQDHVLATAKHFLADGGTHDGKDQGDAEISEKVLRDIHGLPYEAAIAAGVQTVMVSFSSWNGVKMSANKSLLTGVLKGRMGFSGFTVSDWNAVGKVPGCTDASCPESINDGMDMLMVPADWKTAFKNLLAQVKSGQVPMARLDDAVSRILRVKLRAGLFKYPQGRPDPVPLSVLGSAAHRALARRAVRESLVLLKNHGGILPLNPHQRILVAGESANSMMRQSGGWTVNWQGTGLKPSDFPGDTTIWAGIRQQVRAAGGHAVLSVDGHYTHKPDVAIVVFGEKPYAEFQGDRDNVAYDYNSGKDLALIKRLRKAGIPVVSVFVAGRPLWVNREINASNAFVMAWLPGSEGGGVADVILRGPKGNVQHDFHGKLPAAWPRTAVQVAQSAADPQYPYGFGLTYEDHDTSGPLPEISDLNGPLIPRDLYMHHGETVGKFKLTIAERAGTPRMVASVPARTPHGAIEVKGIDYQAQEDARQVTWSGQGGTLSIVSPKPLDLQRESNGDVNLVLTLRVDKVPAGTRVEIGVNCSAKSCQARLPFSAELATLKTSGWTRLGVPLKCFDKAGADLKSVTAPLVIDSHGPLQITLNKVQVAYAANETMSCPAH